MLTLLLLFILLSTLITMALSICLAAYPSLLGNMHRQMSFIVLLHTCSLSLHTLHTGTTTF